MPSQEYLKNERSASWREDLRKTLKNKDRTQLTRVKMNSLDPQVRSQNYEEVNLGLTAEQAMIEAQRC
ncbi:MAG: dihydropyrimidine dehydrogenase, partial [Dysgonamonadaceae bacterium]|nr:dihydropyrimidine dehydrogenase [Dysgonamonadaceae bacterium]